MEISLELLLLVYRHAVAEAATLPQIYVLVVLGLLTACRVLQLDLDGAGRRQYCTCWQALDFFTKLELLVRVGTTADALRKVLLKLFILEGQHLRRSVHWHLVHPRLLSVHRLVLRLPCEG